MCRELPIRSLETSDTGPDRKRAQDGVAEIQHAVRDMLESTFAKKNPAAYPADWSIQAIALQKHGEVSLCKEHRGTDINFKRKG
jgi:hypothetical protein